MKRLTALIAVALVALALVAAPASASTKTYKLGKNYEFKTCDPHSGGVCTWTPIGNDFKVSVSNAKALVYYDVSRPAGATASGLIFETYSVSPCNQSDTTLNWLGQDANSAQLVVVVNPNYEVNRNCRIHRVGVVWN